MINLMVLGLYSLERQALSILIERDSDINVIDHAKSIEDINTVCCIIPDIIIIFESGSYNYCFKQIRHIKSKKINSKIILLLSSYIDCLYLYSILRTNVNGYILKNTEQNELFKAIRVVYSKGFYMRDELKFKKLAEYIDGISLTKREVEILFYIFKGYKNKRIANILHIKENTVKNHIYNIYKKLNVKNKIEVIVRILGNRDIFRDKIDYVKNKTANFNYKKNADAVRS
ncbi:response regulator transcription factor [Thermoanaerobacterium thermosaccharolyticum]|uniref:response regulator transcription factor n=1 Tax=Thermoanaerobacterium thermosaccharolyticum TaxID=1517 RepID=UPI00177C3FCB|nr:response regulator transcription factor [Thermoanaerobacterium thermosaccharolyticum]MBE0068676.1 response regulator transcription factor [Thermoanaerobacterium thermosaccharolyticum]MBE0228654.1 response regulator transcription factor [Thermoanaerobacterium thermosaccharolyticum]MCP2238984.1 DNA-binding NarL/FixJ family response regulator [Thermoanaerobacterium thermosaccharolyticum]